MNALVVKTAILAALIVFYARPLSAQQEAIVGVDQVILEPLSQTQPIIGQFVARQAGIVSARVAGTVTEVRMDVGDRVQLGDILAIIDLDRMTLLRNAAKARSDQAKAQEDAALARFNKRQNELSRIEGIRDSAAYSEAKHDEAIQNVFEAEAEAVAATARFVEAHAMHTHSNSTFRRNHTNSSCAWYWRRREFGF